MKRNEGWRQVFRQESTREKRAGSLTPIKRSTMVGPSLSGGGRPFLCCILLPSHSYSPASILHRTPLPAKHMKSLQNRPPRERAESLSMQKAMEAVMKQLEKAPGQLQ